jgi:hypothetical protein
VIALCLQTCDRADYTARTLATFAAHNDLSRFRCLHADDASTTPENAALAARYGFTTVHQTSVRTGMQKTRTALFRAAQAARCAWVLLLENDIETVRPIPWPLFDYVAANPKIYCLRLSGRFKDAAKTDAYLNRDKWTGQSAQWAPLKGAPESAQIGRIHWTAQPTFTRTADAISIQRGKQPGLWTARVKKNVMNHVGVERTPGRLQ